MLNQVIETLVCQFQNAVKFFISDIKHLTLDQWLSILSILVSIAIAIITYCISRKLSAKSKYDHEVYISGQLSSAIGRKIILADVKKYNSDNGDTTNADCHKQACGLEDVIPVYGVKVSLRDSNDLKLGIVPFDWIEYVRPYDSEDSVAIVVCKFKGIKWNKNFKIPIKEIIGSKPYTMEHSAQTFTLKS